MGVLKPPALAGGVLAQNDVNFRAGECGAANALALRSTKSFMNDTCKNERLWSISRGGVGDVERSGNIDQGLTGIAPCNRFLLLVMRQFWSAAKFRPARALAAYCPARMLLGVGSILLPPVRKATAPAETCTKRQYTPSV